MKISYITLYLILAFMCACCNSDTKSNSADQTNSKKEMPPPVTLTFRGSDTLGAKMIPMLAEEYQKQNPHVSFEIPAAGGRPNSDDTARFLMNGGIITSARQITNDEMEHLYVRMRRLKDNK